MFIYSKYHTRPLFSYFSIGNERLTTTANARSLGLELDDNMLFDVHVSDKDKKKSHTSLAKLLCMFL